MGVVERGAEGTHSVGSYGDVTVSPGFLEARGRVAEVSKSLIPQVTIYSIDCGNIKFKFDVHSKLLRLRQGDEVIVTLSKDVPTYNKGVDLVMWGYVINVKTEATPAKIVVSLWGYIVTVEADKKDLISGFGIMDKVYFKVTRESTSVST